jgi:hypothetical protein
MMDSVSINIEMPPGRQSCPTALVCGLRASKKCVSLGTQDVETGLFLTTLIRSIRAIGVPFQRSFEGSYINSGKGCTSKLLRAPKVGD